MGEEGVLLSVRGDATRTVAPDVAAMTGSLEAADRSKAKALAAAAAAQQALLGDLAQLGGVPLKADTERSRLTWSAYSARTQEESHYNPRTGRSEATGRVVAAVRLQLAVRDLSLLQDLSSTLARHEAFHLHYVSWHVDDDNPEWAAVRRDAIQAALLKARDYARSLGASLVRVEQVADSGLLGDTVEPQDGVRALAMRMPAPPEAGADAPSLDPVPQDIRAVIEARVRTSPATLPG